MGLLETIRLSNDWERLPPEKWQSGLMTGLNHFRVVNAAPATFRQIQIRASPDRRGWEMLVLAPGWQPKPLAVQAEDGEGHEVVLVVASWQSRAGSAWGPVARLFYCHYRRRQVRKVIPRGEWSVSEVAVPAEDLDLNQKKNMVRIIFHSYNKLLSTGAFSAELVPGDAAESDLPSRLKRVLEQGRPFFLSDVNDLAAFSSGGVLPAQPDLGMPAVELLSFADLEAGSVEEARADYNQHGVSAELIWPVVFSGKKGPVTLGYLRWQGRDRSGQVPGHRQLYGWYHTVQAVLASIRQANVEVFPFRQALVDITARGAGLIVENTVLAGLLERERFFRGKLFAPELHEPLDCGFRKIFDQRLPDGRLRLGVEFTDVRTRAGGDPEQGRERGRLLLNRALARLN